MTDQAGLSLLPLLQSVGTLSWCDELEEAERVIDTALEHSHRSGDVVAMALWYYARSWPRYWRGRVSEATADAQAAVDAWGRGLSMYLPTARYWLASSLLERGEVDAASKAAEPGEGEEHYRGSVFLGPLLAARGRVAAAQGDPASALDAFLAAGDVLSRSAIQGPAPLPWRSEAALVAAQLGQTERARELAEEEVHLARTFGSPRPLGIALRAQGMVLGGESGIEVLRDSVAVLRASPSTLELVRALVELGATQRRAGHSRAAREPLREGLDIARRLGALALETRAEEELAASGARPRRRELTGVESLTPSERRVAEMGAQGLTNREIAQALFVTVKAVQWHLRNTYRKLEVEGREGLPEALGSETALAGQGPEE